MNNSYFLKKSHVSITPHVIIVYVLIIAFGIFKLVKDSQFSVVLFLVIAFSTVIVSLIIKYEHSVGLYINGMNVYYKNLKTREIDINNICGVKIIQSYSVDKYKPFYPLKNHRGEFLYSAIILKSLTEEMVGYTKGDLWFVNDFKKHIICWVVYEKNAIDYLKDINPNIKIIQ